MIFFGDLFIYLSKALLTYVFSYNIHESFP
jgi:hypothetical protein